MRFTVLTPTYNRAHSLGRVYQSLLAQTFCDFEWLIIDDGSTDGTRELVASWSASFPIVYRWKPNGGKHTAVNLGVSLSRGELATILDSDDCCIPTALERFDYHWQSIPNPEQFANISCPCMTTDGKPIGKPFPPRTVDLFSYKDQMRFRFGIGGEGWGVNRTDVMRQFPYPEGERYVPEALVWNRISEHYASRIINEPLRIYRQSPDSITTKITALRVSSPKATLAYYKELAISAAPLRLRTKSALNFVRFAVLSSLARPTHLARKLRSQTSQT